MSLSLVSIMNKIEDESLKAEIKEFISKNMIKVGVSITIPKVLDFKVNNYLKNLDCVQKYSIKVDQYGQKTLFFEVTPPVSKVEELSKEELKQEVLTLTRKLLKHIDFESMCDTLSYKETEAKANCEKMGEQSLINDKVSLVVGTDKDLVMVMSVINQESEMLIPVM
ncbi:MAG: hypothetical protein CL760_09210 [Chloroflexi bacterium]|nr:hypothetical protein [Chloroflexota bacterium]